MSGVRKFLFTVLLSIFVLITLPMILVSWFLFSLFLFICCSRINSLMRRSTCSGLKDVCELGSLRSSLIHPEKSNNSGFGWRDGDSDDLCQIDMDDLCNISSVSNNVLSQSTDLNKVINLSFKFSKCLFDYSYTLTETFWTL